jgi:hypothetical protein
MTNAWSWLARALLALVLAVALYGAINPRHVHSWATPPDALEHAVYAFVMLILAATAFPRASLVVLTVPLIGAGAGLEILQALGLVAGTFQASDVLANLAGIAAALFALAGSFLRSQLRRQPSPASRRRRGRRR